MSGPVSSASWTTKAWQAALVLLGVALVARVIWMLLAPMLPALGVMAVLVGVIGFAVRRRRF